MYFHNLQEFIKEIILVFKERRFFYSVKYCFWVILDLIRGVDFVKNEGRERIGVSEEQGRVYQATRDTTYMKRILDGLPITQQDAMLDLGCGKGYMLKYFSGYPFKKVGGVELSERLCEVANQNIRKLKMEKCVVYCSDAADFVEYDEYTYLYIFDSFPAPVMKKVMENIKESLYRRARKITVIYKSPVCHDAIIKSGLFELLRTEVGKTLPYNIYVSR